MSATTAVVGLELSTSLCAAGNFLTVCTQMTTALSVADTPYISDHVSTA